MKVQLQSQFNVASRSVNATLIAEIPLGVFFAPSRLGVFALIPFQPKLRMLFVVPHDHHVQQFGANFVTKHKLLAERL